MNRSVLSGIMVIAFLTGLYVSKLDMFSTLAPDSNSSHVNLRHKNSETQTSTSRLKQKKSSQITRKANPNNNGESQLSSLAAGHLIITNRHKTSSIIYGLDADNANMGGLSSSDEDKTPNQLIAQLSSADESSRVEALTALKQYKNEDVIPQLKVLLEETQDQQLKAQLKEVITFIELPEFTPTVNSSSTVDENSRRQSIRAIMRHRKQPSDGGSEN